MIYPAHDPFPLPDPLLAEVERLTAENARLRAAAEALVETIGDAPVPRDVSRAIRDVRAALAAVPR